MTTRFIYQTRTYISKLTDEELLVHMAAVFQAYDERGLEQEMPLTEVAKVVRDHLNKAHPQN